MKTYLATVLRRLANRLDPAPTATRNAQGGWRIDFAGVPLAEITSGCVSTDRRAGRQ